MATMRIVILVLLAGVFTVVGQGFASEYALPLTGQARILLLEGTAFATVLGTRTPLAPNDTLQAPAKVAVAQKSRMELGLADGSVVRFAPNTRFTLVKADAVAQKSRDIQVDVAMGGCWAKVQDLLGKEGTFEVNSPTAVAGVAGTVYRLNVKQDKGSQYLVYDGKINVAYSPSSPPAGSGPITEPHRVSGPARVAGPHRVTLEEWMVVVGKGYSFSISPTGQYSDPVPFDMQKDRRDPWVKWNMERDRQLSW
ncbi:FecR family protein [Desulfoplanes sp.]